MRIIFAFVFIMMMVVSSSAVLAARPDVVLSGFNTTKVEVGKDFVLKLYLSNKEGNTCAGNTYVSVQAASPFIMRGVGTVSVGQICGGEVKEAEFPLRIDPAGHAGFYQLTITADYESTSQTQFSSTNIINIGVSGSPEIEAQITNSRPLEVYPGDTATVTFALLNSGSFEARSVTASLEAASPLSVLWSQATGTVGPLDVQQSRNVDFSIKVPKDADSGSYSLVLTVDYLDENLDSSTKLFPFYMDIEKKALFTASDDGTDMLYPNQNARTVRLMVKNTGTEVAEELKVQLIPSFPFSTDGTVRYIDTLAPGKSKPVTFTVNTDKDATPGTYALDLLLDFQDPQGDDFSDTTPVSLTINSETFVRAVFINYWFIWAVVLIVVVILIVRVLGRKKTGKKK